MGITIGITGPESTGKSALSRQLAQHYQTVYVEEYARAYIGNLGRDYQQEDILHIAKGQLQAQLAARQKANRLLICDTELLVTKVWSMHKYACCDPWILDQIAAYPCDFYLLCDVDLPWEYDKQREHPHLRHFFFDWYRRELDAYGFKYQVISGQGFQRLEAAIQAIDRFVGNLNKGVWLGA